MDAARKGAWGLASLVGLAALGVYLRTLYPGLVGDGDTPKFQYVGAVGGTPHNPGYPLYLVLSWLFSRLPFGNLAWRVNLLSAVAAALFVLLQCRLARLLGASAPVAAAVALAAGFGPVLWSQATLAEVYSLAAALLSAVLVALVAWGTSAPRREAPLLFATALFALALGHHLTIVFVAPALLLYALLVDRPQALRGRVLLGALGLGLAGLSQYLLIVWRTRRGAPYLGSTARNLSELLDVVRGAQFGSRLFAYDLGTLVSERLPLLLRVIAAELGGAGLLLAIAGLALLLRRRRPEGPLLGLGALGVLLFALNYKVDDPDVFLVPVFALLWPAAAVGLQALAGAAAARTRLGPRVALLALLVPSAQLGLHFKANDHSDRTFEMRYFAAVVERAPRDGVFLAESYTVDQMLLYELLGEGHAAARGLRLSAQDPRSAETYARRGQAVFAFARTRQALAAQGFRFEAVELADGPLPDVLARLPAGFGVLLASPVGAAGGLERWLRARGLPAPRGPFVALVSARGGGLLREGRPAELVQARDARLPGAPVALPRALTARLDDQAARLAVDGGEIAAAGNELLAAWVSPAGRVVETLALDPRGPLPVPFSRRAFPLFRLTQLPDGTDLREGGCCGAHARPTPRS